MQKGELVVVKNGSVSIPLKQNPSEVKCHFIDEQNMVVCDAANVDLIEYEVQFDGLNYTLIISWSVSGTREMRWIVGY